MNVAVLYHANCWDGFGAAWAASLKLGRRSPSYIPVLYGNPPPEIEDGSDVYILDFSYSRTELLRLASRMNSVTVIDHHKSAQAELEGLEWCRFDLEHSGAVLAWQHFHDGVPPPSLLLYVEDRDLWRFALPQSREVAAALRSYPYDFEMWDRLADVGGVAALRNDGVAILRFQSLMVETMCRQAIEIEIGGHKIPCANATVFFSEVGERLLSDYPVAPFSGYYLDRADGKRQWGLRGRKCGIDVSEIAKLYGGGGHADAAGFVTTVPATGVAG